MKLQQFKFNVGYLRSLWSSQRTCSKVKMFSETRTEETQTLPKSFSEIPRVKNPVKTIYDFLSGKYSQDTFQLFLQDRVKEYGEIYCEKTGFGPEEVFTSNPRDFKTLYEMEDKENPPLRKDFWSVRDFHKQEGTAMSLISLNGKAWMKRRENLRPVMLPNEAVKLTPSLDKITNDFFDVYLEGIMDKHGVRTVKDYMQHLTKWTFECIGMVVFRRSMGIFQNYDDIDQTTKDLYENSKDLFKRITPLEMSSLGSYSRTFRTEAWREFESSRRSGYNATKLFCKRYKQHVINEIGLTPDEVYSSTYDVLLGGTDSISGVALQMTIDLAKNSELQDRIHAEIAQVVGDQNIDAAMLQKLPYLRGAYKEILRLRVALTINNRIVNRPGVVLSGYEVPEKTSINMLLSSFDKSQYFTDANEIIPERWIRSTQKEKLDQSYLVMPFGHGMRSCAGRRIAENEILLYIIKLIRSYRVELIQKEIPMKFQMTVVPDTALDFIFHKR